jgi:hypothetical protein
MSLNFISETETFALVTEESQMLDIMSLKNRALGKQ